MNGIQVMERVAPIMTLKVREVDPDRNTEVQATDSQVVFRPGNGGHSMAITDAGRASLAHFVGFPKGLEEKVTPGTYGRVATELLRHVGKCTVLSRENEIVGFANPAPFQSLNPEKVLATIERAIPDADFDRVLFPTNTCVSLEVVGQEEKPVVRGDLVRAGALVNFSPFGTLLPSVQSYVTRLVCTNGATHNDVLRQYTGGGGEGDNVWQWFRKSLTDSVGALYGIVERYRAMRDERIPPAERASMIEALVKQAKLDPAAAAALRSLALEAPPRNTYEAMNLLTNVTTHFLTEPRQIQRARNAIAAFAQETEHARLCPVCRK